MALIMVASANAAGCGVWKSRAPLSARTWSRGVKPGATKDAGTGGSIAALKSTIIGPGSARTISSAAARGTASKATSQSASSEGSDKNRHAPCLSACFDRFAEVGLGAEELDLGVRKGALLNQFEQLTADGAGCADNRHP